MAARRTRREALRASRSVRRGERATEGLRLSELNAPVEGVVRPPHHVNGYRTDRSVSRSCRANTGHSRESVSLRHLGTVFVLIRGPMFGKCLTAALAGV